jgi:uncharacterized protein YhjY with autotransporter beta-barrel domain
MNADNLRLFGLAVALLLAAPAARAQEADSTFTTRVSGRIVGAPEDIKCSGPVKLSIMVQRDPDRAQANAIVTVDTTDLKCMGVRTKTSYVNSGHSILTRLLSSTDVTETSIAVYPDTSDGHMNARSALLSLNLSYNVANGALRHASVALSNTRRTHSPNHKL